jgi:hypothetical protein
MTRPPQASLELRVAPPHEFGRGPRGRSAHHEAAQPPGQYVPAEVAQPV